MVHDPHPGADWSWDKRPNGDLTCSYCGSHHPRTMVEIMHKYAEGEEGYRFDVTTKSYKLYGNRPGVRNASEGGIKFYTEHMDPEWKDAILFAHSLAVAKLRAKMSRGDD